MFYSILKLILEPLMKNLFSLKVTGLENVPEKGGYILAMNHFNHIDPVFIAIAHRRRIYFLTKEKAFKKLKSIFWVRLTKQIPVKEGNSDSAIKKSVEYSKNGKVIGIFPEGTTVGAPRLRRFRTGVARIALEAKIPIIPVALINTTEILSERYYIPKKIKQVTVRIGKPLYLKKYYGRQNDRKITKSVANKVRLEVRKLLNTRSFD